MPAQNQNNQKKKSLPSSLIWLAVFLWFLHPGLMFLFLVGIAVYVVTRDLKKTTPPARRKQPFVDCPTKLFCFHRDKGEHHVRHGREADPWDRPDIDISKYQRNR